MKEDFFQFRSKLVTTTVQAHAINLRDDNDANERWNLVKGNFDGINFPVIFQQEYGNKFRDILDTGWAAFYLISEYMIDLLKKNNISGWKTYDIKLLDKKQNEITGYKGLSIIGKCDLISYRDIVEKRRVPTGPLCKFYKGMLIEGWDGSDFFSPKEAYHIIISKKAAEVLKKGKITNLHLENCSEYEKLFDIFDLKKFEEKNS